MFGLTRREQRWKAEQQAAELLVGLVSVAIKSAAQVKENEILAQEKADALEVEKLRLKVAELEIKLATTNKSS